MNELLENLKDGQVEMLHKVEVKSAAILSGFMFVALLTALIIYSKI